MAGKQAKILSDKDLAKALRKVRWRRHAARDRVMLLLSTKAGLRAGEIAGLTWAMVQDANGCIGHRIEVADGIAKKRSGRTVPMHPTLRTALIELRSFGHLGPEVIRSERDRPMRATSVVNWFRALYGELGLRGCSSHSGRRTFITQAARLIFRVGGSLRDVQQLAGHSSIEQTQAYIDGDTVAKRRLVALL